MEDGDGEWLTLPHTKAGGNCASSSLGPLKYVLWVRGRVNGVELGFLVPGQGGGVLLAASGSSAERTLPQELGKSPRPTRLLVGGVGMV